VEKPTRSELATRKPWTSYCGESQLSKFKLAWQRFRSHFWLALFFDALVILSIFLSVHAWQTRDLPVNEPAPETLLAQLDGAGIRSVVKEGEPGIVYFFAPWCFYCRSSIGNLDELVEEGRVSWGTVVALDYGDASEVQDFIEQTGISLPVLMGTGKTAVDWGIRGFPTYFVVDADGRISSRSVGYSTKAGMMFRNWKSR
jgi:thiol-disulfide isomerase/thioredoxin